MGGGKLLGLGAALPGMMFGAAGGVALLAPTEAWGVVAHHGKMDTAYTGLATRVAGAALFCLALVLFAAVPRGIMSPTCRQIAVVVGGMVSCVIAVVLAVWGLWRGDLFDMTAICSTVGVCLTMTTLSSLGLMADVWPDNIDTSDDTPEPSGSPKAATKQDDDKEEAASEGGDPECAPLINETNSEPAPSAPKAKGRKYGWKRMLSFAALEKTPIAIGCLALLIRLPFSLAVPHFVSEAIAAVGDGNLDEARRQIFLLFIAGTVDSVLDFWNAFLFGVASVRLVSRLRNGLFAQLLRQEVDFYDQTPTGDLSSRLQADTQEMADNLSWVFRWAIEGSVRIFGIFAYMLVREWRLGLLTCGAIPVISVINKLYRDWLQRNAKTVQTSLAKGSEVAFEVLCSVRTVLSFANQGYEVERYKRAVDRWSVLSLRQRYMSSAYGMIIASFLCNNCIKAGVLLYGVYLHSHKNADTGVLIAFMLYQGQLQGWIVMLLQVFTDLVKSAGAGEKVFELMDRVPKAGWACGLKSDSPDPDVEEGVLDRPSVGGGCIKFENVAFKYSGRKGRAALNDVSFVAHPGETVALVGQSGAGKSTCFHLLEHYYDPHSGVVTVDGVPVHKIPAKKLHSQVALVGQEPVLFSGSIRSNIIYSVLNEKPHLQALMEKDPAVKAEYEARMRDAARKANAADFIAELPDGYDTKVGEKGASLSGGQKQRIAIARAIMQAPRVLLLDEATSALDAQSEYLVQQALQRAREGRTTLVIAHRLSTVKDADRIIVFEKGQIVEQGSHAELLAKDSAAGPASYRNLVNKQLCPDVAA
eukprot:Hpha_TRINITY_DN15862_c1_g6::TRINITY_DN15862_c1_g6_i1::g.191778::m.191778/K05656/ABCB9, TAPL; ATP-binding cassette, subfamily B (MDR/TAP), member 9